MEHTICLAGNPNSGKTTLFNRLCGAREKIGNWSGTTVERKEGFLIHDGQKIEVVDLPGTYSLNAYSIDEKIARDFLLDEKPDLVVAIIDASNLERNVYLVVQLLELGQNVLLVLNMMDVARSGGVNIDVGELAAILGIDVAETIASKNVGIDVVRRKIIDGVRRKRHEFHVRYGIETEQAIEDVCSHFRDDDEKLGFSQRGLALRILQGDEDVTGRMRRHSDVESIEKIKADTSHAVEMAEGADIETHIVSMRRAYIKGLVREISIGAPAQKDRPTTSDKIDRIPTHRYLGIPIFLVFMVLLFQLVFLVGGPVSELIGSFFGFLSENAGDVISGTPLPAWVGSLVGDGIIAGVGSVLSFLPIILLLYLGISIMEDSGYLSRGAFVMDRFMHALGLHGKSFIPMLLGFGCNVAGVMAARTLDSRKDRIITVLVNPLMSCAARLPVYTLFAGVFFPRRAGMVVFSLYLLGIVLSILVAKLFKSIFFREESAPLVMELPPYHLPDFKNTVVHMWVRASLFVRKAGTVIVSAVIIVWLLSTFPYGVEYASEDSIIGRIGTTVAPVFEPAGFGEWQSAVALMTGVMAKEVIIGTFGTLYGAEEGALPRVLPRHFSPLSAYSFLIMILVYIPCIATIGVIRRETNWRWAMLTVGYTFVLAWILSTAFYQIGNLLA